MLNRALTGEVEPSRFFSSGPIAVLFACLFLLLLNPSSFAQTSTATLPPIQGAEPSSSPGQTWAYGSFSITINGLTKTVPYGQFSTPGSMASGIAVLFVEDPQSHLWIRGYNDGTLKVRSRNGSSALTYSGSSTPSSGPANVFTLASGTIASTSLSLRCSPSTVPAGTTTSCAVSIMPAFSTTISLYDGSSYNTVTTDPSGNGVFPNMLQGAGPGRYTITANYAGDSSHAAASASTTVAVYDPQTGPPPSSNGPAIYSYSITQSDGTTSGYDPAGNITAYTDTVNGQWTIGYDSLNRVTSATQKQVSGKPALSFGGTDQQQFCWTYDEFGNRKKQVVSPQGFGTDCQPAASASFNLTKATYDSNNRITSATSAPAGYLIDDSGNVTNDGSNEYLYDAEGKLCASHSFLTGKLTGYLYDADGRRSAKGNLTSFNSCDLQANGFSMTSEYIAGQDGEPLTELDGNANWLHTNTYADGQLVATYDSTGLHFNLFDLLGTRRVQTNYAGLIERTCSSAAFGDILSCSGSTGDATTPTEIHLTGKERDSETNLDYFEARFYGSDLGRFLSPDVSDEPEVLPFADFSDPQSLNLYAYALNSPSTKTDPTGHEVCPDGTVADACATAKPEKFDTDGTVQFIGKLARSAQDAFTQAADQFHRIIRTPGGAGCLISAIGAGAAGGAATGVATGGVVALATGGTGVVVVPGAVVAGTIGGGIAGGVAALTACPGGAADGGGTGGSGGGGSQAGAAKKVTFKHDHAARHLAGSGLDPAKVENAIAADVQASVNGASSSGGFWGKVVVDGQTVTYRAMTLADGSINVGTYTLPRP